jgi:polysaccharide pyruvyl transferase WcaK-like protein
MESRFMLKVVIPEGIPSLNKGEAAILEGLHEMLSQCGPHEITLYSPNSWRQDDARNYRSLARVVGGLNLHGQGDQAATKSAVRSRLRPNVTWWRLLGFAVLARGLGGWARHLCRDELLTSLAEADVILAAHDGMMGPIQSHIVRAGHILNKPVVLLGSGCGSSAYDNLSTASRRRLRYAARNATCCVVRDQRTYELLTACGVEERHLHLAPDPAVLLPPCATARVTEILDLQGIPQSARDHLCAIVPVEGGIVARESFAKESKPERKRERRVALWKELLQHLLSTTNAYVILLPHSLGPSSKNDDRHIAREIHSALAGMQERIQYLEDEYSPGELKGLMKRCRLVLSERAHAAIGSFSAGTPCVGFSVKRDIRMHSILHEMFGRPVCDLDEPDVPQLKSLITDEWNNASQTSAAMAARVENILAQARAAAEWVHARLKERLDGQL